MLEGLFCLLGEKKGNCYNRIRMINVYSELFNFLGAKMSSLTRYSSYERLMLGKQKLIECSSMQAFEKFKLEDKELKESLNSSMYASGVHGLSKCWSDGDENHLQEGIF